MHLNKERKSIRLEIPDFCSILGGLDPFLGVKYWFQKSFYNLKVFGSILPSIWAIINEKRLTNNGVSANPKIKDGGRPPSWILNYSGKILMGDKVKMNVKGPKYHFQSIFFGDLIMYTASMY